MTAPANNDAALVHSIRIALTQGERAMEELGWTHANIKAKEDLNRLAAAAERADKLEHELEIAHFALADERDRANMAEAALLVAQQERDEARRPGLEG